MRRSRIPLAGLLALAAPETAHALPLHVQAEVGGFIPRLTDAYGETGARFLSDFGAVDQPDPENDVAFGLSLSALPLDSLEVGLSFRRLSVTHSYSLVDAPEIRQHQESTTYPIVGTVGLRAGPDFFKFSLGAGLGAAVSTVVRSGYLDDSDTTGATLCARFYSGVAFVTGVGLEIGGLLSLDAYDLPETKPFMPIEDERSAGGLLLAITLGWVSAE